MPSQCPEKISKINFGRMLFVHLALMPKSLCDHEVFVVCHHCHCMLTTGLIIETSYLYLGIHMLLLYAHKIFSQPDPIF